LILITQVGKFQDIALGIGGFFDECGDRSPKRYSIMKSEVTVKSASLYDTDYQLWLDQTVARLQAHDFGNLDLEHLIEEIESLGKSDKRAIYSYLLRLCEHLLKVKHWESERVLCFRR
jgi:hypothetical protein